MSFGARLQEARLKKGLTLEDVANKVGKTKSTVQRYETGEVSRLDNELIILLSEIVGVSPIYLMGWEEANTSEVVSLPVLGSIACGEPITADENINEYREILKDNLPSGKLFYLVAKGDSMYPKIPDGSYVLVREQQNVENGEIAAVLVNGDEEATLKRVRKFGDRILLEAINDGYAPYLIDEDNPARIIGKAVKLEVDL